MRGRAAGRVDVERSRRAAMGEDHGTSDAGAMGSGVDRVRGTCAARLPLQRAWLVMGLGPCDERAHLLCSVIVMRRALYQRGEGRDVARVPWARGVDAEVAGAAMAGSSWTARCRESCSTARTVTGSKEHDYIRRTRKGCSLHWV